MISNNDHIVINPQQHQLNMEKHPIARVPTLAAIEEQSITAALTKVEDRPKVTDIFPSQEPSDDPTSEQGIAIALSLFCMLVTANLTL